MNARSQPIMVPVQLGPLLAGGRRGKTRPPTSRMTSRSVRRTAPACDPRSRPRSTRSCRSGSSFMSTASSTIAWACLRGRRAPARAEARRRSTGHSSLTSGRACRSRVRSQDRVRPTTDVLVLGNHGLVVAADSVEDAAQLSTSVTQRLRRPARPAPPADARRTCCIWRTRPAIGCLGLASATPTALDSSKPQDRGPAAPSTRTT